MMRSSLIFILVVQAIIVVKAQNKLQQDMQAIKSMCGCYEVRFEFAETFAPDENYVFHPRYITDALEWVQPVEINKSKLSLQHLLIVEDFKKKQSIIKHWRQDWLYENEDLFQYEGSNRWTYHKLAKESVKGQWTQKVYHVDDGPRYEASATWVHVDGKHFWESTANSPLPRREYTHRSDYNILKRFNRHELTSTGWLHDQNNDKIIRDEAGDQLLAQEKGLNFYKKVDDSKCLAAKKWWEDNDKFWADVRNEWQTLFDQKKDINLLDQVENKPMYKYLQDTKAKSKTEIHEILAKYVKK